MASLYLYLLIGFFINWAGSNGAARPPGLGWKGELIAILLWPLVIILFVTVALVILLKRRAADGRWK